MRDFRNETRAYESDHALRVLRVLNLLKGAGVQGVSDGCRWKVFWSRRITNQQGFDFHATGISFLNQLWAFDRKQAVAGQ